MEMSIEFRIEPQVLPECNGERALCAAIIQRAIEDMDAERRRKAREAAGSSPKHFGRDRMDWDAADAQSWIRDLRDMRFGSFGGCCHALGIDPDAARQALITKGY